MDPSQTPFLASQHIADLQREAAMARLARRAARAPRIARPRLTLAGLIEPLRRTLRGAW